MKTIKEIDEFTLEMKDVAVEEYMPEDVVQNVNSKFRQAIACDSEEFAKRYREFKEAKERFDEVYETAKSNLIKLYEDDPALPKSVCVGGAVKLTYVSPNTRSTIDTKKLKEEEPAIAEKFTKSTKVSASIRLEDLL